MLRAPKKDALAKKAALDRAKEAAGGAVGLARLLEITSQAITQWEQVPINRVFEVERVTGVSRYELRPDFFTPPGRKRGRREEASA